MSIVKSYSKANKTTYVYEQNMKWNPATQRPEGTRKLIGKIDPVSGAIVATNPRGGRRKKEKSESASVPSDSVLLKQNEKLQLEINTLREQITSLRTDLDDVRRSKRELERKMDKIAAIVGQ